MKQFSQSKKNMSKQKSFGYSSSITEDNSSKRSPKTQDFYDASIIKNPKYLNTNVLEKNFSSQSNIFTTNPTSPFQSITNKSPNMSNIYLTELDEKNNPSKKGKNSFLSVKNKFIDQYLTFKKQNDNILPPIINRKNNNYISPKNYDTSYLDNYNCRYLKGLLKTARTEASILGSENISIINRNSRNLFNTQKVSPKGLNQKRKKIAVKDSNIDYITKTKEINLLRYRNDIQKQEIKKFEENLQNQKNIMDNSIKVCENFITNLDEIFLVNFNNQLRQLNKNAFQLKIQDDNLVNKIVKLKNEIQSISFDIMKANETKTIYDKWADLLSLLIYRKPPKKNSQNPRIKEFAISDVEDLDNIFENKKLNNINLLIILDEVNQQKNVLNKEYNNQLKEMSEDDLKKFKEIKNDESILKELKKRNNELKSIKKQFNATKKSSVDLPNKNIVINPTNIYEKISDIYSFIINNDDLMIVNQDFKENSAGVKNCLDKNKKALMQLKIIEIFYITYRNIFNTINLDEKDKAIVKGIKSKIDLKRRHFAARKKMKEDEERLFKMKEDMIMRVHRVNYKQNQRVDVIPDFYKKKFNKSENKKKINNERKITIFDFFYDVIDEANDKNNEK